MKTQSVAKAIWQQLDVRTVSPHGDPDWVVIRDLTKNRPGLKPLLTVTMSMYTANVALLPEHEDVILEALRPRKVHDTKVRPGDSLGIVLVGQPFPHRTWVVTDVDDEGIIHVRSGDKLNAEGKSVPTNNREILWHSPPSSEHVTAKMAEEPFLDAWVSLRSIIDNVPAWWSLEADRFSGVADVFIDADMISDESEEDITETEWAAIPGKLDTLATRLIGLDHDAYGTAHQIIQGLVGQGVEVSRKYNK